jgi:hypothetical protein
VHNSGELELSVKETNRRRKVSIGMGEDKFRCGREKWRSKKELSSIEQDRTRKKLRRIGNGLDWMGSDME